VGGVDYSLFAWARISEDRDGAIRVVIIWLVRYILTSHPLLLPSLTNLGTEVISRKKWKLSNCSETWSQCRLPSSTTLTLAAVFVAEVIPLDVYDRNLSNPLRNTIGWSEILSSACKWTAVFPVAFYLVTAAHKFDFKHVINGTLN
jgi:hypothetical protein